MTSRPPRMSSKPATNPYVDADDPLSLVGSYDLNDRAAYVQGNSHGANPPYESLPYTSNSPHVQGSNQQQPTPYDFPRGGHQYPMRSVDLAEPPSDTMSTHSRVPLSGAATYPPEEPVPPAPRLPASATFPNGGSYNRQTLSEKVRKSSYDTSPVLPRRSTADLLKTGAGLGPYQNISTQSSSNHMVFAEGDFLPQTKASRVCMSIFASNIVIRWFVFITPIMALLWIPGIIGLTVAPSATVWGVKLIWWSAWLSVWWGGWWVGLMFAKLAPKILHHSIGTIFVALDKWIAFLSAMQKPITSFIWALLSWVFFNIFITKNQVAGQTDASGSGRVIHLIVQFLFGVLLSTAFLVVEKLVIQIIAANFHAKSYQDRILEQKSAIRVLIILYLNSHDIGRGDTLDHGMDGKKGQKVPAKMIKSALKGVRNVAQASTTVFGTVASEIAGERIMQPNAPDSMVTSALSSSNRTRQLARRLFFSFVPRGRKTMIVSDIAPFFSSMEAAEAAFRLFDKDENGDATLEEMEMECLELHRERLALASSMRDLDSAVGRLDAILVFFVYVFSILVIIALLDVSFQTLLASAGTLILGLSWLIGTTAQEILASIIFLFGKHPYDVGDRVDIDSLSYVVKEMHLLYTVFHQTDGKVVQIPHSILNTKTVVNIRRSGAISEAFEWSVDFDTTFEQIDSLRNKMLEFLETERRDFLPSIDISVKDFEDQGKITLKTDIKYKSNWQNGALKVQRRNKFLCALKLAMAELDIFGPAGAGNPSPPPVPQLIKMVGDMPAPSHLLPKAPTYTADAERIANLKFSGQEAAIQDYTMDIFDERGAKLELASEGDQLLTAANTEQITTARDAGDAKNGNMRLRQTDTKREGDDLKMQARR